MLLDIYLRSGQNITLCADSIGFDCPHKCPVAIFIKNKKSDDEIGYPYVATFKVKDIDKVLYLGGN